VLRFPATVHRGDGRELPCVVVDMSHGGACISAPSVVLPDQFKLSLNSNASVLRHCKVMWRSKDLVGVQFLEPSAGKETPLHRRGVSALSG
jgi:hypothetical protein